MLSHQRPRPLPALAGAAVATAVSVTAACLVLAATASAGVTAAHTASLVVGGTPLDGATQRAGFTATLVPAPGTVASVKWTLDGSYLGNETRAPFQLVIPPLSAGQHRLRARVYGSDGTETKVSATFSEASGPVGARPTTPPTTTPPTTTPPAAPSTPAAHGAVVHVSNGAALTAALAAATPGTSIVLADGTYTAKTEFTVPTACTAAAPCTLTGSRAAVLDGAGLSGHYGLHLTNASYWTLSGFTVTDAAKGIVADHSSHNLISGVEVSFVGDEGLHLRDFSTDNVVRGSVIHDTGQKAPQYGEGVYVGSAKSNWASSSGGVPDNSDRNQVIGNTIYRTGAENVDIKEGTTGGVLAGNSFNGAGMSGLNFADSWVDVKGNGWTISGNVGTDSINDGFQTHVVATGWGQDNVFSGNTATVNSVGYGFDIQSASASHTTVSCSNVVTGAKAGFGNTPCTP